MSAKVLKGTVVSTKMQKTVVVAVQMNKRHKLYDKVLKRTRRFKARDDFDVQLGSIVSIQECRPFSKEVSWRVLEPVEANVASKKASKNTKVKKEVKNKETKEDK
jgi:small subunit ribosomal protein S17